MLAAGKYKVLNIIDAGLSDNRGTASPYIKFEIQGENGPEEITWFGSLKSEKSSEMAVKSLVVAGYLGNDFEDLHKPHQIMFSKKDLVLTIEHNEYNGKVTPRVQWINESKGLSQFAGQAPKMAALFAKFKNEAGVKTSAPVTGGSEPF